MGRKKTAGGAGCLAGLLLLAWAFNNLNTLIPTIVGVSILWIAFSTFLSQREKKWLGGLRLEDLDNLSGADFEKWISARLESEGISAENIQHSGDFGVDVIATVGNVRIGIQAKRYSKNVGNDAVQQAVSGSDYHDCQAAAVVTQAGFTKAAAAQAKKARLPITLVGRRDISKLVVHIRRLAHSVQNHHSPDQDSAG